jgi:potassium channel subfamily K
VHPASRVLLFPFSLIGIAFLGTLIQMIVNFFSDRSAARKEKSRALYERERQEAEDKDQDPANLQKEIAFLNEINQKQDVQDQFLEFALVRAYLSSQGMLTDVPQSFAGFTVFWLIGGAIFMALESQWSFGVSMYFCYVLFFTIGQSAPTSPRVERPN